MADETKKAPPRGALEPKQPVNLDLLTETDKEAVEKKVLAEIEAEAKAQARAAYTAEIRSRLRREVGVGEQQVTLTLDLAPYVDRMTIDGVVYMHGRQYTVRYSVADAMLDMQHRTWNHQAEIDGKSTNFYRQARGLTISPSNPNGGVGNILRA